MLEIENLAYRHTDTGAGESSVTFRYALKIEPGQIAGVTGKSGSGKSTLLDLIAGFLWPDQGEIRIGGADILDHPPENRPLTILFQNNNLFDHLSVADNIGLGVDPSLKLSTDQKQAVEEAITRVGLAGKSLARAQRLSGGEQQRAALARSLVRRRPVLLLDEPFSALDGETRAEMLALVREITNANQLAVLLITHDPADCDSIADSHYVMSDGELNRKR